MNSPVAVRTVVPLWLKDEFNLESDETGVRSLATRKEVLGGTAETVFFFSAPMKEVLGVKAEKVFFFIGQMNEVLGVKAEKMIVTLLCYDVGSWLDRQHGGGTSCSRQFNVFFFFFFSNCVDGVDAEWLMDLRLGTCTRGGPWFLLPPPPPAVCHLLPVAREYSLACCAWDGHEQKACMCGLFRAMPRRTLPKIAARTEFTRARLERTEPPPPHPPRVL